MSTSGVLDYLKSHPFSRNVFVCSSLFSTLTIVFLLSTNTTFLDTLPYAALGGLVNHLILIEIDDIEAESWFSFSVTDPKTILLCCFYCSYAIGHAIHMRTSFILYIIGIIGCGILGTFFYMLLINQQNSHLVTDKSNMLWQEISKIAERTDLSKQSEWRAENVENQFHRLRDNFIDASNVLLDNYAEATAMAKKGRERLLIVCVWVTFLVFSIFLPVAVNGKKTFILVDFLIVGFGSVAGEFQLSRVCRWNSSMLRLMNDAKVRDSNIVVSIFGFVPAKELLFGYYVSVFVFLCRIAFA